MNWKNKDSEIIIRNYLSDLLNMENEIRNSGSLNEFDDNVDVVDYLENLINLLNDEIEIKQLKEG